MTKRKSKTKQALGVLPDRYAARTDVIQTPLLTLIAQILREASEKQNQLDYYLNGSNYVVKPDQNGRLQVYMNDSDTPIPEEFLPRLRQSNRYIDMAFTSAPELPTISPMPYNLKQEQRYSPEYQNVLRRQRQNVYEHNQAKQQAQAAMSEGLDYIFNPARWYNEVVPIYNNIAKEVNKYTGNLTSKADKLSKDDVATVGLATMFVPGIEAGKFKAIPEIISKSLDFIQNARKAGSLVGKEASLNKIERALAALEKNPTNATAIRTLRTQFKANPELVADLESAKLFDGMDEFNLVLQPFKTDVRFSNSGYTRPFGPVSNRRPYSYQELMQRILPENRGIMRDGKYWRSTKDGFPLELKEGDWFFDENNQLHRIVSKDGKLTDLLDSDFLVQRRQQIAAETEAKVKEAEQRGRDAAKKEMEKAQTETAPESATPSPEVTTDQPKKYAYLPLANGETIELEVNGNTAVDPITGSTFELYPGTTRIKYMDYTPNPSFYSEYNNGKGVYDPDNGNPAKWEPLSFKGNPLRLVQRAYTKAGNPNNPQRLVNNYGVWDFANKDKGRLMNNTREWSPKKLWGLGLGAGLLGAAAIQGRGLWGVSKSVGAGATKAGSAVLFGNDKPWETPQDSTKKDTLNQATPYQEPVDTMDAWGVSDMDAQLDSVRQARLQ